MTDEHVEQIAPARFDHGGSGSGYRNYGCRCDLCRAAHARSIKRGRENARIRASMPEDTQHGIEATYDRWCCRCPLCKRGKGIADARRRLARLEAELDTMLGTSS